MGLLPATDWFSVYPADERNARMQSLLWYKNRLQRMSVPEMGHRAVRLAGKLLARLRPPGTVPQPRVPSGVDSSSWIAVPRGLDAGLYLHAANRILRGTYSIFALEAVEIGRPPQWNTDPLTGVTAPLHHATLLDYRDVRSVGNIKYLWEPNRHLHLVTLAQAYALSSEPVYAAELRAQLESWFEQCPYPRGPNWASSLELSIRLINWSLSWQLLGGHGSPVFESEPGRRFRAAWLESVYLHARHIVRNLSRFSSANNHLIGEAAGVFVAALAWPYWTEMGAWGKRCRAILLDEALKQNAPDGGNREQAISYQQFVLDFLLLSGLAARRSGKDFPADYWHRIERMTEFLASMMDVGGNLPMIGDADDGVVVRLAPAAGFCPFRSLIGTGAVLFDRPDLASKAGRFDDQSAWLLGAEDGARRFAGLFDRVSDVYTPQRAFPESGYYLLGSGFETPEEVRMIVDAGPLGYLSLAAHGHADALAVVLSVGGKEVLVDPGTFCYHTEPEWRSYFRGTSAHNTITVDGRDQSVQLGNFMWSDHATAECLEFRPNDMPQVFVGAHEGYCRLGDAVRHQREIRYDPRRLEFEIIDAIRCRGSHEITRQWHFAEDLAPEVRDGACIIRTARATVTLAPMEALQGHELLHGSLDPAGGWVSRRFGHKIPSHTLRWTNTIAGDVVLRTRIVCRLDGTHARSTS